MVLLSLFIGLVLIWSMWCLLLEGLVGTGERYGWHPQVMGNPFLLRVGGTESRAMVEALPGFCQMNWVVPAKKNELGVIHRAPWYVTMLQF